TEGLLLITNDGEISHKLLSPKSHVDKTYFLLTKGRVTDDDVDLLEKGIDIGDEKLTLPAEVSGVSVVKWDDIKSYHDNILSSKEFDTEDKTGEFSSLYLTIHEGRYHQVKRMMAKVGKPVLYLKRVTMGTLKLDGKLSVGDYRKLTEKEVEDLKKA
ncbi:MAG: pseudouridine synthase, partial [Lachnospiraceae bacterium]|nr:pseudouridine synthase [Lachnospiraceae bacterium]